jgi:hypothetical protein
LMESSSDNFDSGSTDIKLNATQWPQSPNTVLNAFKCELKLLQNL